MFHNLSAVLQRMRVAASVSEARDLALQLRRMCAAVRASLETHVRYAWSHARTNCTVPADRVCSEVPWTFKHMSWKQHQRAVSAGTHASAAALLTAAVSVELLALTGAAHVVCDVCLQG